MESFRELEKKLAHLVKEYSMAVSRNRDLETLVTEKMEELEEANRLLAEKNDELDGANRKIIELVGDREDVRDSVDALLDVLKDVDVALAQGGSGQKEAQDIVNLDFDSIVAPKEVD
jgi:chromosome segregation ATPase